MDGALHCNQTGKIDIHINKRNHVIVINIKVPTLDRRLVSVNFVLSRGNNRVFFPR